jgi:hypothetical protein
LVPNVHTSVLIMSADTAAFFAGKKKKKAFKFNANLVDVTTIAPRDHVYVLFVACCVIRVDNCHVQNIYSHIIHTL